ncbi:PREDICTED: putative F-box/kelch-repeat protein At1g12170 [Camelina sativa]|uniref:F-box/kelch-repeat protein At1g12170 n=1 Tax=Camelina sativa TaxID=90675 RepID=A0ABM1RCH5_CAMSA|nr:PREDICTED: putative F-box/kelch-repeat protein At1g12170 [Camelina sativa]
MYINFLTSQKKIPMASVNLPWDMVEEILSRVPPKSLVRFGTVCKQWKALFQEKSFVNTELDHARPEVILMYDGKIFSIDVNLDDLAIEVRRIFLDIPTWESYAINYCDGLLSCELSTKGSGTVVWNPSMRQGKQILKEGYLFLLCGIGYNRSRPEMGYKIFAYYSQSGIIGGEELAIYDCASETWEVINAPYNESPIEEPLDADISLNGNSYWTAYNTETSDYFIRRFDYSKKTLKNFCMLPCKKNSDGDTHYLSVFRGERFSMLEQCYRTREIEIWVTKNKIRNGDEKDVVWIKFMNVSLPDMPRLSHQYNGRFPSYFVDNIREKSFVMCCYDETHHVCIYIVRGDMSRKIEIDFVDGGCCHAINFPSLIPIA